MKLKVLAKAVKAEDTRRITVRETRLALLADKDVANYSENPHLTRTQTEFCPVTESKFTILYTFPINRLKPNKNVTGRIESLELT